MKFLYPEFLWALTILLIPVIIHLFNFKRYKTIFFSNVAFLKNLEETTKSVKNLKNYLILAARMLMFASLVIAFAQPYFGDSINSKKSKQSIRAFYLDNSFSMQAKGMQGELLLDAKERIRELVDEAPIGTNFIISTNDNSGNEKHLLSKSEAHEKIDKIDFSPLPKTLATILKTHENIFSEHTNSPIQQFILSDFSNSSIQEVATLEKSSRPLIPIQITPTTNQNLSVDSIWFDSPFHSLRETNQLNIKISNHSQSDLSNVLVGINVEAYNNTIYAEIKANSSSVIHVNYKEKKPGIKSGVVSLTDNNLNYDNQFFFSYTVQKSLNVLVLDGQNAVQNIQDVYSLDNFYQLETKKFSNFTLKDVYASDLVVLNGVNNIPSGTIDLLSTYYTNGGNVAVFPGTSIDFGAYNQLLKKLNLGKLESLQKNSIKISKILDNDPFYLGVFTSKVENISIPPILQYYSSTPNTKSSPLIQLQNDQALLEYSMQKGKAFLFLSSLDNNFTNITSNGLFPTLLLRIGELSQRHYPNYISIGEGKSFPIYEDVDQSEIIQLENEGHEFIPIIQKSQGLTYIAIPNDVQLKAGNYTIKAGTDIGVLSMNYKRDESKLNVATEEEITNYFIKSGFENVNFVKADESSIQQSVLKDKNGSIWFWFVLLAVTFVMIEMLVIRLIK